MNVTRNRSLSALDDEAFRKLVDQDLRGRSPEDVRQALRSPENVDRWFSALLAMTKSVEGQLAAKKTDWSTTRNRFQVDISLASTRIQSDRLKVQLQEERERYNKWRAGILRFKTGLDEFLADARRLRDASKDSSYDRVMEDERLRLTKRIRLLEEGIRSHRDTILSDELSDDDHEEADEELWNLI